MEGTIDTEAFIGNRETETTSSCPRSVSAEMELEYLAELEGQVNFTPLPFSPFEIIGPDELSGDIHNLYDMLMSKKFASAVKNPSDCRKKDYKFITLTTASESSDMMKIRAEKLLRHPNFGVIRAVGCIEYTKTGLPHIHMCILKQSGCYIRKAQVQAINKQERIDIQTPRDLTNVRNYILKTETKNDENAYFSYLNEELTWLSLDSIKNIEI